jgi:hypothetical protein
VKDLWNIARFGVLLAAAALVACGPHPIARVSLLADLGPAAPPTTQPAVLIDVRPTALAAVNLAEHMARVGNDARYVRTIGALFSDALVRETVVLMQQTDPETRARAAQVISFNAAMNRFLAEAMTDTDPAARDAWIRWGLSPDHMKQVAAVYDNDPATRVMAARDLAGVPGPEVDHLLAILIRDPDREVALRAIDSAWDRAPGDAIVDALWEKGVLLGLRQIGVNYGLPGLTTALGNDTPPVNRTIIVRGRAFPVGMDQQDTANRMADASIAVDLLLAYNHDKVRARIDNLFIALAPPHGDRQALTRAMSPNYGDPALQLRRLVEAYSPPHALPSILAALGAAGGNSDGYTTNMNGRNYRISSRIDLFAIALDMLQESHDDYGLVRLNNWGNRWVFDGTEEEENKSVKKILEFWKEHYKQFGAESPDLPAPDSNAPSSAVGEIRTLRIAQ